MEYSLMKHVSLLEVQQMMSSRLVDFWCYEPKKQYYHKCQYKIATRTSVYKWLLRNMISTVRNIAKYQKKRCKHIGVLSGKSDTIT